MGERHPISSFCRRKSLPDWGLHRNLILLLDMRLLSLRQYSSTPWLQKLRECFNVCVCYMICFLLLLYSILFSVLYRRRGKRSDTVQTGEDINLNRGERWNWIWWTVKKQTQQACTMHRPRLVSWIASCWEESHFLSAQCLTSPRAVSRGWKACRGEEGKGQAYRYRGPGIQNRPAYCEVWNHISC